MVSPLPACLPPIPQRLAAAGVSKLAQLAAIEPRRLENLAQRHYPFGEQPSGLSSAHACLAHVQAWRACLFPCPTAIPLLPHRPPQATRCTQRSASACRPPWSCGACRWHGCRAGWWSWRSQVGLGGQTESVVGGEAACRHTRRLSRSGLAGHSQDSPARRPSRRPSAAVERTGGSDAPSPARLLVGSLHDNALLLCRALVRPGWSWAGCLRLCDSAGCFRFPPSLISDKGLLARIPLAAGPGELPLAAGAAHPHPGSRQGARHPGPGEAATFKGRWADTEPDLRCIPGQCMPGQQPMQLSNKRGVRCTSLTSSPAPPLLPAGGGLHRARAAGGRGHCHQGKPALPLLCWSRRMRC